MLYLHEGRDPHAKSDGGDELAEKWLPQVAMGEEVEDA